MSDSYHLTREKGRLPQAIVKEDPRPNFHILTLGESKVGKSCLIKRYCEERFVSEYIPTIGIDYGVKVCPFGSKELRVHFWDVGGDSSYHDIRTEFYKDMNVALIIFDCGSKASFHALRHWLEEAEHFLSDISLKYLIATKTEVSSREVTRLDGIEWADEHNCRYFEVSSHTGEGVKALFETIYQDSEEEKAAKDS